MNFTEVLAEVEAISARLDELNFPKNVPGLLAVETHGLLRGQGGDSIEWTHAYALRVAEVERRLKNYHNIVSTLNTRLEEGVDRLCRDLPEDVILTEAMETRILETCIRPENESVKGTFQIASVKANPSLANIVPTEELHSGQYVVLAKGKLPRLVSHEAIRQRTRGLVATIAAVREFQEEKRRAKAEHEAKRWEAEQDAKPVTGELKRLLREVLVAK
jgi:hypothetical protein